MFQPRLKDEMKERLTVKAVTHELSIGYSFSQSVAWALLYSEHRKINQWPETRKEQPCQLLRSPKLSMGIHSRFPLSGNGTAKPARVSGRRAMTLQSCTLAEAKPQRTNCQDSFSEKMSICGRLVCDVYFRGKNLADYFPEYQ